MIIELIQKDDDYYEIKDLVNDLKKNPKVDDSGAIFTFEGFVRGNEENKIVEKLIQTTPDKEKAKKLKTILEQYHDDIRESRKLFKTRKDTSKSKPQAKGGYVPSPTPYDDIQEDLDKAMGGIGIAMGIVGTIILLAFLLLMKKIGY